METSSVTSECSLVLEKIFGSVNQLKLSYLPPLMLCMAAGVSSLTGIVGTFFIKDYLDLCLEFLAMLCFWIGLPWDLKMVLGQSETFYL